MKKDFVLAAMLSVSAFAFQESNAMDQIKMSEENSIEKMLKNLNDHVAQEDRLKLILLERETDFKEVINFLESLKDIILNNPKESETVEDFLNVKKFNSILSSLFSLYKKDKKINIEENSRDLNLLQKNTEYYTEWSKMFFEKQNKKYNISMIEMKQHQSKGKKFKFRDESWVNFINLLNEEVNPKENFSLCYEKDYEKIIHQWIDFNQGKDDIFVDWLTQQRIRRYGLKNMMFLFQTKQKTGKSEISKIYEQLLFRRELQILFPLTKEISGSLDALPASKKINWEKFAFEKTHILNYSFDSSIPQEERADDYLSQFDIPNEEDSTILLEHFLPNISEDGNEEDEIENALKKIEFLSFEEKKIKIQQKKPLDVIFIICKESHFKRFSVFNRGVEKFIEEHLRSHCPSGIILSVIDLQKWENYSEKVNPWMVFFFGNLNAHKQTVQKIQQHLLDVKKYEHLSYICFNHYLYPFKNKNLFHVEPYIDLSIEKQLKPKWVLFYNISTDNREKSLDKFFQTFMLMTKPIWGGSALTEQVLKENIVFPDNSMTLLEEGKYNMRGYVDSLKDDTTFQKNKQMEPPFGHIGWNLKIRVVLLYNLMPITKYADRLFDVIKNIFKHPFMSNCNFYKGHEWFKENLLTDSVSRTRTIRSEGNFLWMSFFHVAIKPVTATKKNNRIYASKRRDPLSEKCKKEYDIIDRCHIEKSKNVTYMTFEDLSCHLNNDDESIQTANNGFLLACIFQDPVLKKKKIEEKPIAEEKNIEKKIRTLLKQNELTENEKNNLQNDLNTIQTIREIKNYWIPSILLLRKYFYSIENMIIDNIDIDGTQKARLNEFENYKRCYKLLVLEIFKYKKIFNLAMERFLDLPNNKKILTMMKKIEEQFNFLLFRSTQFYHWEDRIQFIERCEKASLQLNETIKYIEMIKTKITKKNEKRKELLKQKIKPPSLLIFDEQYRDLNKVAPFVLINKYAITDQEKEDFLNEWFNIMRQNPEKNIIDCFGELKKKYHDNKKLWKMRLISRQKETVFHVAQNLFFMNDNHLKKKPEISVLNTLGLYDSNPLRYEFYQHRTVLQSTINHYLLDNMHPLIIFLKRDFYESANELLNLPGIDVNVFDLESANTPLHIAVAKKLFPIIEKLLQKGANINAFNYQYHTPLSYLFYL